MVWENVGDLKHSGNNDSIQILELCSRFDL